MSETLRAMWRDRVASLTPDQRRRLAERLVDAPSGATRLTGFVVMDQSATTTEAVLRTFLAERLPDYMIPTRVVQVERLPRTAAGKLDRSALGTLVGRDLDVTDTAPAMEQGDRADTRTDAEETLLTIWRDVLKVEEVGLDDDFFEIGGDSLLSIRVIARAGREGIRIAPERFFERPTVRHMAASAAVKAAAQTAAENVIGTSPAASPSNARAPEVSPVGIAPLTPIQHWFLDEVGEQRDWWNQAYVLEMGDALDGATLEAIGRHLTARHDALRLRLVSRDGVWQQEFVPPVHDACCRVVTLDGDDPAGYAAQLAAEGEREHASMRVTEGRLFRLVMFGGAHGWRRLLVLAHHLVVDGVSWAIVLDDLATLLAQAANAQPLQLPPSSGRVSPRAWSLALPALAHTEALADAARYWLTLPDDGGEMPVDTEVGGRRSVRDAREVVSTHADADVVTIVVEAAETKQLLQDAPRRLEASTQALLLTALLMAWREWSASDVLTLDLEGHGRDVLGSGLDASRTVGWFTTVFPLRLATPSVSGAMPSAGAIVREVRRTLDALPRRGAAHGLMRHYAPDEQVRERLSARRRSTVLFNYLGIHDLTLPAASRLRVTREASGNARSPHARRPYLLECNARVEDGALTVTVEYARQLHARATIERFAMLFRDALERVATAPADDAPAGLDATGLQTVADLLGALDAADDEFGDEAT